MLLRFLLWRITKGTYLTAFTLAFILLMVQIFRIGFILFGLPPTSSVPFFLTWFAYYGFFFIGDGVITATALTVHELKEKRLLHVLYSFHISPLRLYALLSVPMLLFFVLSTAMSFLLFEEQVSFARRGLLIQYKDKLFENLPQKTFLESGGVVIYTSEKRENELKDIFVKYRNIHILAQKAVYEGKGRFLFEKGSMLTKEKGKYFLMEFEKYWLDTEEFLSADIREKRVRRERLLNIVNTFSIPVFFTLAFAGVLKLSRTHTQTYYLIATLVLSHQLLLFAVKILLKRLIP